MSYEVHKWKISMREHEGLKYPEISLTFTIIFISFSHRSKKIQVFVHF